MMAMTTNSSIRVKALDSSFVPDDFISSLFLLFAVFMESRIGRTGSVQIFMMCTQPATMRPLVEWTFRRGAWTFGLRPIRPGSRVSGSLAISRGSLRTVAPPVLRWRMVMHLAESPRKIKLFGEPKLVADLLDGHVRAVEHLHGMLHAQVVQVAAGRIA